MAVIHVGDPVSDCFTCRILQGSGSSGHWYYLGPQQPHANDIQLLAPHVFLTHVDNTTKPETGTDCRGRDSVLSRACFCNDPFLAKPGCEEGLTNRVVYLVRASMVEVLALQEYPCAYKIRETRCVAHGRRTTNVAREQSIQLPVESRVAARALKSGGELIEGRYECLRHVTAAKYAEPLFHSFLAQFTLQWRTERQ